MNCTVVEQCNVIQCSQTTSVAIANNNQAYVFLLGFIKSIEEQLHRIKGLRHDHLIHYLHYVEHFEKKLCVS